MTETGEPSRHHVTTVLVTHDGERWLPRVLDGLDAQTRAPDVVAVADTASGDSGRDLVRAWRPELEIVALTRVTGYRRRGQGGAGPRGHGGPGPGGRGRLGLAAARLQRARPRGAGAAARRGRGGAAAGHRRAQGARLVPPPRAARDGRDHRRGRSAGRLAWSAARRTRANTTTGGDPRGVQRRHVGPPRRVG